MGRIPAPAGQDIFAQEVMRRLAAKTIPIDLRPHDPVGWIETHFRIPREETPDMRLHLVDYQKEALRRALSRDANGNYNYAVVLWGDIKKSIKSVLAAAVHLWKAWHTPYGSYYIIANDLKQANSRVAYYLRRCIELHPQLTRECKVSGYTITLPNRATIEAIPVDPKGEAGSNADGTEWCMDEETEVLTRDGFKGHELLSIDDEVATLSPSGEFQWQKPCRIINEPYSGLMHVIETQRLSMKVTPNHRIYGKFLGGRRTLEAKTKATWEVRPAREACESTYFVPRVTCATWQGELAPRVSDGCFHLPATPNGKIPDLVIPLMDWVEFMAWYLSEGCVIQKKHEKPFGVSIAQSEQANPEKRKRILDLIRRMGLSPREWAGGKSIAIWHLGLGELLAPLGKSGEKYIPDWIKNLPCPYLEKFIQTYAEGDGRRKAHGWLIGSKSWQMRDDLIEIAQKCGYAVTSWETVDHRWTGDRITFEAYIRLNHETKLTISKKQWQTVEYSGRIFCPSTQNGIIFVRRHGRYHWTGNTELWGATGKDPEMMWTEMTSPPNKFGRSQRWIDSYAGYENESLLLYRQYETCVLEGQRIHSEYPFYENKSARMFALWNTQPRCPWQTDAYYASEELLLTPSEFNRVHRNQWAQASSTFIPIQIWDRCKGEIPPYARESCVGAIDGAISNDSFAVTVVSKWDGKTVIRYARCWYPPKGGNLDFEEIQAEIVRLTKEFAIVEWAYDPTHVKDMCNRLMKAGVGYFYEFSQGQLRLIADKAWYDQILQGNVLHSGEPDLREHVMNSNSQSVTVEGKQFIRIVKRTQAQKVDLNVACSMASHELQIGLNIP